MAPEHEHGQHEEARPSAWAVLGRSLAPRPTRAQLVTGLLCAGLGFALVVQVQTNRSDGLSTLRQDELVRILDDVTRRAEELGDQVLVLRAQRNELVTGSDTQRAAREAAAARAEVQGILAGRLPAQGPGVELVIRESDQRVPAPVLYNVLEELRNAGAEAIQVDDQRVTAASYFLETPDGIELDGVVLRPPYRWLAIGDPDTMTTALAIPGGALAMVRTTGGTTTVTSHERVEVTAVRTVSPPRYATPVPVPDGGT